MTPRTCRKTTGMLASERFHNLETVTERVTMATAPEKNFPPLGFINSFTQHLYRLKKYSFPVNLLDVICFFVTPKKKITKKITKNLTACNDAFYFLSPSKGEDKKGMCGACARLPTTRPCELLVSNGGHDGSKCAGDKIQEIREDLHGGGRLMLAIHV